jgi:hypothetical protein
VLRAFGAPPCADSGITRSRGSVIVTRASRVASSGPSMTTTTSMFWTVCASALPTARVTSAGRPRVGITTLTSGVIGIEIGRYGPSAAIE